MPGFALLHKTPLWEGKRPTGKLLAISMEKWVPMSILWPVYFLITPYNMKKVICLLIFVAAALLTWHSYNFTSIGLDDANIYFKYARNLANGFGFVYNPGGE